jgi:hypothetical protein
VASRRPLLASLVALLIVVTGCAADPTSTPSATGAPTASASGTPGAIASGTAGPPTPRPSGLVEAGADLATPLGDHYFTRLVAISDGFALLGRDFDAVGILELGSADASSWRRPDTRSLGLNVNDLAVGQDGWVLLQQGLRDIDPDHGIQVWWSGDGRSWLPLAPAPGMDKADPVSVSAGPLGFATIGQSSTELEGPRGLVWTSKDGRSWTGSSSLPAEAAPEQVLISAEGFVALATGANGETPIAWTSTDGAVWLQQPAATGPLGEEGTWIHAAGNGRDIVIVRGDGTVWITRPHAIGGELRLEWQHVEAADRLFGGQRLTALTGSPRGGFIALGWDRATYEPTSWMSGDGVDWQMARLGTDTFDGGVPELVTAGPSTIVALGSKANRDGRTIDRPWVSADGLKWTEVDADGFGTLPADLTGPCPAALPTTPQALEAMAPELWPTCFGHRTLTIRAYVSDCGGCGGASLADYSPAWLDDPMAIAFYLTPTRMPEGTGGNAFGVRIDPEHPVKPRFNALADVSGHFDDPAASICRSTNAEFIGGGLAPPETEIASCRREFVAESIRLVGR